MSQENVEFVQRLVALWEGDAEIAYMRDDAAWARYKPRIEPLFEPGCTFAWVGGGIESEYSGLDGFREGWLDIYEALESARNQFEQVVPVGDKVLVLIRLYARIAGAEHDVVTLAAAVCVVRDGRVARAEFYANVPWPSRPLGYGRRRSSTARVRRARGSREQHVERVAGDQRFLGRPRRPQQRAQHPGPRSDSPRVGKLLEPCDLGAGEPDLQDVLAGHEGPIFPRFFRFQSRPRGNAPGLDSASMTLPTRHVGCKRETAELDWSSHSQ